ncbi:MAG: hypothetical protein CMH98_00930 [Oceanospirillaceae bacterium]|nr:hypothetical protein [Oceanospirillaceae bacterium]
MQKRDAYRSVYRHQAVLHFLPHFTNLRPLVTGAHKRRVCDAIRILERWKRDLPRGAKKQFKDFDTSKFNFKKADSPPAIILPMPPTKLKIARHPTPPPPEPERDFIPFSMQAQYPNGFPDENWDVLNDL